MKIKISIVDDHPMVISGLSNMLKPFAHFEVVKGYLSGQEMLDDLVANEPDVILMDIMIPDVQGPELAKTVNKLYPEIKILAVTSINTPGQMRQMMKNGCSGFLLKNTDQQVLVEAIETIYNGGEYIEGKLKEQFFQNMLRFKEKNESNNGVLPTLTRREKEILRLIIQEHTNQQIADKLFISLRTVENHRFNLQQKLNVNNMIGLVKVGIQMGLD